MAHEMSIQPQVSAGVSRFINFQSLTLFLDLWLEAVLGTLLCVFHVPVHISSETIGRNFLFIYMMKVKCKNFRRAVCCSLGG
jgi:hypothetical protein